MASGGRKTSLHAVWNTLDEPTNQCSVGIENSKAQEKNPQHKSRRDLSVKPKHLQRTSLEHRLLGYYASYNHGKKLEGSKGEMQYRPQKQHSPSSHMGNHLQHPKPEKDKHLKKTVIKERHRNSSQAGDGHSVEQSALSSRMKGYSARSRSSGSLPKQDNDTSASHSQKAANHTACKQIQKQSNIMSFRKLQYLSNKHPDEILLTLLSTYEGFSKLIASPDISNGIMSYILIALGKACRSKLRVNVLELANTVTSNHKFMFYSLVMYLLFLQNNSKLASFDSLSHLIEFLKALADFQPATAAEIMSVLSPHLLQTVEKCGESDKAMKENLIQVLNDLIQQTTLFLEQHTEKDRKKATAEEKMQLAKPPEDFREISILPMEQDMYDYQPFLRPNVVRGKYLDMDHYLDVQFRLLREDFTRPLREGMAEYRLMKNKQQARKCKDLRLYLNVHVIGSEFVHGTLVHILQFEGEKFKKIQWEYSKRFLTGSLLCLSNDNFQTMLFATVVRREPEKLKKGLLLIKFEELTNEILNITALMEFTILETQAYFEAYRHVLVALQNVTVLPLKKYILDVDKNVNRPEYLLKDTVYDISPLLLPVDITAVMVGKVDRPKIDENRLKYLPILNDSLWPNADELGLDVSQFKALKAALTKEFSVIQGPPGTGKTYIGLRIVQLLLHNADKWNTSKAPILIVCYTNHALDQFLEGILNFTQKVVRIGGRCNSEKVEPYHLSALKRKIKMERDIPRHIYFNIKEKSMALNALQSTVSETEKAIERSCKTILSEVILKPYMTATHYTSLKRGISYYFDDPPFDDDHVINDWLEIRFRGFEQVKDHVFDNGMHNPGNIMYANNAGVIHNQAVVNEAEINDGDISNEDEGDVDFIEAMREVNDEDFSGVNYDLNEEVEVDVSPLVVVEGPWKTQGGAKERRKLIRRMLRNTEAMNMEEANRIVDIWSIPIPDRWRLYNFWLANYIRDKQEEISGTQKKVRQEYELLCEMKFAEDLHVLKGLEIVGMTTTGAAKYRSILQNLDPRVVIVEEAAEILESHIVTSLASSTQHLILIGDHQQLRPSPTVYQLATKYNLNISLFERMISNGMDSCVLSIQHRMRPSIASLLVPHIYSELKNDDSVLKYEDIKGVRSNMFFLNHDYCEGKESDSQSKVNHHEALFLVELCRYLLLQGYLASQITILTAYSGQLMLLRRLTKGPLYKGVRITVVDNFQGEENDIILISFVRSNDEGLIGFLQTSNRVCVALSRAKKGLYCIGNFMLLAEHSTLWKGIMKSLEDQGAVGDALELVCQNHPDRISSVVTRENFKSVPEGGCTRPCEYRLECGHTCTRMCHPYDPHHEKFKCNKKCGKIVCENGHACERHCFEECGKCCVKVLKTIPVCKHEVFVPCHMDPARYVCTFPCNKRLSCDHPCRNSCGELCTVDCRTETTVKSPCGHNVNVPCYRTKSRLAVLLACQENCDKELECGHKCCGTCSKCHQGRLHMPCRNPCHRILVCGHQCHSDCAQNCPPCQRKCENRCVHSKCPQKCGVPCNPCKEKCNWQCIHKTCTKLCSEPCNRSPCDIPCPKLLRCGHPCVGLCGEPCPRLCAVCHNKELTEVFFGTEDEEGARFIQLEDCKHVFEVEGLTRWMQLERGKMGEIQMKNCPKCKTVIRKNLRFGYIIKACLQDVTKVKNRVYGEKRHIYRKKETVLKSLRIDLPLSDKLIETLSDILSKHDVSVWEVNQCENIINIAAVLKKIYKTLQLDVFLHSFEEELKKGLQLTVKSYEVDTDALSDCICETAALIDMFLHQQHMTSTLQQLEEISCELQRLKSAAMLYNALKKSKSKMEVNKELRDTVKGALDHFLSIRYVCFTGNEEETFKKNLESIKMKCGGAVLGIDEDEKKLILKAMNLRSGHWYQCPNGHVYCITECGGATMTSTCNECGAAIGGANHAVLSDNRVATAMDGAVQDAWTVAANAENYDLNNLL